MHVAVCSEWAFSCARSPSYRLFPTLPSPYFNCYSMVLWSTWHTRTLLQCIFYWVSNLIYFNLVRYPSYMWKFVSSVLRLGETLRSALQSGDMVSVICFRAWFKMYSSLFVCFLNIPSPNLLLVLCGVAAILCKFNLLNLSYIFFFLIQLYAYMY